MSIPRHPALLALPAAALIVLGAGSAALAQPTSQGDTTTVQVAEQEFALKPSVISVPAGTVSFSVMNQGKVEHELVVVKTDLPPTGLVLEEDNTVAEDTPQQKAVGEVEEVAPGSVKTSTFDLAPGRYVLLCNIPGHYKAGMAASLEVLPTVSGPTRLPNTGEAPAPAYPLYGAAGGALLGLGLALRRLLGRRTSAER